MIALTVAFAASAWLALLLAAPVLAAPVAATAYVFCSLICHQIGERSFHLAGAQLPVCARCLGIYAGLAAAALVSIVARPRVVPVRTTVAAAALPTLATVALEWAGLWQTSNAARFAAGAPLGAALGVVVIAALATLHCGECARRPPIGSSRTPSRT